MELNKQFLMTDSRCKNADCVSITERVKPKCRYLLPQSCSRRFPRVSSVLACWELTGFRSSSDPFETLLHQKRIKSKPAFVNSIFLMPVFCYNKAGNKNTKKGIFCLRIVYKNFFITWAKALPVILFNLSCSKSMVTHSCNCFH